MDGYRWLYVDEVRIIGVSREREVVAVWKQRIEGLQDIVVGIAVAGGDVELKPKPWCPPNISKCVARERADCPGPDGIASNAPVLAHDFEVAVETVGLSGETHVDAVSTFVSADTQILYVVL